MFRKLSLRLQILLIAAVSALGLAAFGGVYWVADTRRAALEEHGEAIRAASNRVAQYQILLLQARRSEKDFLLRMRMDDARLHDRQMGEAASAAQDLGDRFERLDQGGQAARMRQVAERVRGYAQIFTQVVADATRIGFNENEGLQGSLRGSVHAA